MSGVRPSQRAIKSEQPSAQAEDRLFEIDRHELAQIDRRQEAGFFAASAFSGSDSTQPGNPAPPKPQSPKAAVVQPPASKKEPLDLPPAETRHRVEEETKPRAEPRDSLVDYSVYGRSNQFPSSKPEPSKKPDFRGEEKQKPFITRDPPASNRDIKQQPRTNEEPGYIRREPPSHLMNKNSYDYKQTEAYPLFDKHYESLKLDIAPPAHPHGDSHQKHHDRPKPAAHHHQKVDYLHDDGTHDGEPEAKDHPRFKKEFLNQEHDYQLDPYLKVSTSQRKVELVRPEPAKKLLAEENPAEALKQLEIFKQIVSENTHNKKKSEGACLPQPKPSDDRTRPQQQPPTPSNPKPPKPVKRVEEGLDMDQFLHMPKELDRANATVFDQKRNVGYVRVDQDQAERKRLKELERKKEEIRLEKEQEELRKRKEREELQKMQQTEEKKRYELKMKKWEEED
jgi:hypothetical protein